jgi:hypothetical protein
MGMIFAIMFILLVAMVVSTLIESLLPRTNEVVGRISVTGVSLLVSSLLFAAIFKVLPDAKIAWREVWLGAVTTALLFSGGKAAVSFYLKHGGVVESYGSAAGALIALIVWVYYSCIILFIGAEMTAQYDQQRAARRRAREAQAIASTAASIAEKARQEALKADSIARADLRLTRLRPRPRVRARRVQASPLQAKQVRASQVRARPPRRTREPRAWIAPHACTCTGTVLPQPLGCSDSPGSYVGRAERCTRVRRSSRSLRSSSLPLTITASIFRVAARSFSGSALSSTRSARLPTSIVPKSGSIPMDDPLFGSDAMYRAGFAVAHRNASNGERPAAPSDPISSCSANPVTLKNCGESRARHQPPRPHQRASA